MPYVVRVRTFDNVREPNGSAQSSGEFALDRFLAQEYAKVTQFGDYEIWRKAEARADPGEPGEHAARVY